VGWPCRRGAAANTDSPEDNCSILRSCQALRGLNVNHNHDLKNLFKSLATHVSTSTGPLGDFYRSLLAKGMKPAMARLTLARKMAAIVLTIWKKGEHFDPGELKRQAA
jgi:hypothetical protein